MSASANRIGQARPYVPVVRADRKVANDTFVSFEKNRYSVPPRFIGKTIEIIAEAGTIKIRCEDAIIAEHEQSSSAGQTIMNPKHMEELWKSTLAMVPLQGAPHCNVRLDEPVQQCSLSSCDEVCI